MLIQGIIPGHHGHSRKAGFGRCVSKNCNADANAGRPFGVFMMRKLFMVLLSILTPNEAGLTGLRKVLVYLRIAHLERKSRP